jgi:hypothetical protein
VFTSLTGWHCKFRPNTEGIITLTIPPEVTIIGMSAFAGCTSVSTLTLSPRVTTIQAHAFQGCSRITTLTIPPGVTSIAYQAFMGCSGITTLTIPTGVTTIEKLAFGECSSITTIISGGAPLMEAGIWLLHTDPICAWGFLSAAAAAVVELLQLAGVRCSFLKVAVVAEQKTSLEDDFRSSNSWIEASIRAIQ